MELQTIRALSALHRGADFAKGFAQLFKHDTLPNRVLSSLSPIIHGLDEMAAIALDRERLSWHTHHGVLVLRRGIEKYGRHVMWLIGDRVQVWQLGQHAVLWEQHWSEDQLCTKSPIKDLARTVLAMAMADVGPSGRAMVASEGLVADTEAAPSQMTSAVRSLCSKLEREMAICHRSVLLHGPAGAGKTAASRQIADALAATTVVVSAEIWGGIQAGRGHDIFDTLCTWRPDCVIFDDLDRAIHRDGDAYMVGGVSRVRSVVPLVIVTANVHDEFTGSILRPGRIADRILRFDRLDDDVALANSPNVPEQVRGKAVECGLLAAYLRELDIRCAAETDDPAHALDELLHRQAAAGDGLAILRDSQARAAGA